MRPLTAEQSVGGPRRYRHFMAERVSAVLRPTPSRTVHAPLSIKAFPSNTVLDYPVTANHILWRNLWRNRNGNARDQ